MRFKFYSFKLAAILVLIFLAQWTIPGFTELFILNSSAWTEIWKFLTSIFLHAGVAHLLYNLFALVLFGSILERLVGGKKFLIVFFITGVLANLVAVNFYSSSLGASGAIFGVIGALIVVRPMLVVWAFGLPMPIFVAGLIWAAGDLIGAVAFLGGNPIDNTGNFAHLFGMLFGLVFGVFFRNWKNKKKQESFVLDERAVRNWERGWMN